MIRPTPQIDRSGGETILAPTSSTFARLPALARRSRRSSRSGRNPAQRRPKAAGAAACPGCGTALLAEARFCHACGTALDAGAAASLWTAKTITLSAAFVTLVVAATVGAGVLITQYKAEQARAERTAAPETRTGAAPAQSVDISRMSPREAADRLFNRVMAARERGDLDEARRFAPMAVQAYGRVPVLDDDAHYHLGQIHVTAGDLEGARRQIAILREATPGHLLALVLAHDAAVQADDPQAARRAATAFAGAYESEIATERPEYEAHRRTIEEFRALTLEAAELLSGATPPEGTADAAAAPEAAPPGAALFDKNCARCHGRAADGGPGGPPLVHEIYHPGHHADAAFHLAVRQGVRAHHWSYGNMPAIPGVSEAEVDQIIAYVRALQVAAGIE